MLTPLVAPLSGSTDEIHFKHAGAAVKVTINNLPAGAHSIGMEVNGQQVSGDYQINPAEAGSASLALAGTSDNTKNSLWLNFEPSTSEREFTFVFPVPALTKPKLSFKIYDKNDVLVWSKNLKAQSSDLRRADVLVMPATDITAYAKFKTFSEDWTVIGTANGTEWGVDFPMKTDGSVCIAKGLPFEAGGAFKIRKNGAWDEAYPSNNYVVSEAGTYDIIFNPNADDANKIKVVASGECPYPETPLRPLALAIKTVWLKQSAGTSAWNTYYGGTGGSDRNIAMDDDYVYVAENSGTAKLWAISIANPDNVTAVNVEGVTGGTHLLACPRVIKNTDQNVNGGKDVLICSNLTRGGVEPKLYMWINGINNAPKAITLTTWATGAWYGDVFTVYGTLQDGVLFFDKIGGDSANGIVTFLLNGVPSGNAMYLQARLKFNDTFGSHSGACAYYPYPDNINKGVYSPGRGVEARGQNVVASGNIKGEGGIDIALAPLDYDEGTNGYVLGYNFIEWKGKRYVIYGNQSSSSAGYVRVREGSIDTDWSVIASTGNRLYRRDLTVASGSLTSGNSGMDITARVINGELYFAAQKQNVACGLYKLVYE